MKCRGRAMKNGGGIGWPSLAVPRSILGLTPSFLALPWPSPRLSVNSELIPQTVLTTRTVRHAALMTTENTSSLSRSLWRLGCLTNIVRPLSDTHSRILCSTTWRDSNVQSWSVLGAQSGRDHYCGQGTAFGVEADKVLRQRYSQYVPG